MAPMEDERDLYARLVVHIQKNLTGATRSAFMSAASRAYRTDGDQCDLLKTLHNSMDSAHAPMFIVTIHNLLKRRGSRDISLMLDEEALDIADGIRAHLQCELQDIAYQSERGRNTADLIHYTLTSKERSPVAEVIKERSPSSLSALLDIMKAREPFLVPLRNGVL